MKIKATMIVILFFSFSFSAFGKTERLSDLGKLKRRSSKMAFMKRVIDADSIAAVYDAQPRNDYEEFKNKLAPDAGAVVTRLERGRQGTRVMNKSQRKKSRKRLSDFGFGVFGAKKKEL